MTRKRIYEEDDIADLLLQSSDDEEAVDVDSEIEEDSDDDNSEVDPDFDPNECEDVDEELATTVEQIEEPSTSKKRKVIKMSRKNPARKANEGNKIITYDEEIVSGKYGFKWNSTTLATEGEKVPHKNVIHITPGPTLNARQAYEPIDCFKLFITQDILEDVFIHTNEEISRQQRSYGKQESTVSQMKDIIELEALIGLFILSAAMKTNHLSADYLFDVTNFGFRYRATLSARRFRFLVNTLRFDVKETREERIKDNKFAPVSEIWDKLLIQCRSMYKPGSYITIDEQLLGFRGRVPFKMYIPSKPNKYGMKFVMACDSCTKYMIDAVPYLGKSSVPQGKNAGMFYVEKLATSIKGSNRNITLDNWFTGVPLVSKALREMKLTVIGTIKKNKSELPSGFVDVKFKNRPVGSSLFLFHEDMTAVSYKPKTNKLVTLVSSMHDDDGIDEASGKPHIILAYNKTKGGVDSFDQMCGNMNCGRKTRRWPLCVIYDMLNMACINAYVIYVHNFHRRKKQEEQQTNVGNGKRGKNKIDRPLSRMDFMLKLSSQLCEPLRRYRLEIPTLSTDLKNMISEVLGLNHPFGESSTNSSQPDPSTSQPDRDPSSSEPPNIHKLHKGKRVYCRVCPYSKHRYTTTYCQKCEIPVCGEHQFKLCCSCGKKN